MKSIKTRLYTSTLIIFMLTMTGVHAQHPIAQRGSTGIFITFGNEIPIGFNYKLERRLAGAQNWQEIYRTLQPDLNYQVVVGKLLQAGAKNSNFTLPDSINVQRFINRLKGKQSSDSVFVFNSQPAYLETMGVGFYDINVLPDSAYEYRISKIDRKGNSLSEKVIQIEKFKGEAQLNRPEFIRFTTSPRQLQMEFTLNGNNQPAGVRILKQALLQTPFEECYPEKLFYRDEDGLKLTLTDRMVMNGVSYRYLVYPVDKLGNVGMPSDTVTVHFQTDALRPVERWEAKEKDGFIVLNWKLADQQNSSIYRSINFDDGYRLLSRVSVNDTSYTDRQIERGVTYYYYLQFNDLNGERLSTAKVMAMVDETRKPGLAPQKLVVNKTPDGNLIQWQKMGFGIKGYYVYRGQGFNSADKLVSGFIESDSTTISFIDSLAGLVPGQSYCYAVSAVNNGNLEGPLSELAIAEPYRPELPTPLNLSIKMYNNKVLLFWDDISGLSAYITGYRVIRKDDQNEAILATVTSNTYFDSTIVRGVAYTYFIQAVGIQNAESARSASAQFLLANIKPVPPSGLRATPSGQNVVLHWDLPAVEALSGFNIYRERLNETKQLLTTVDSLTVQFVDQPASSGTYFYTVTSLNKSGIESDYSDEVGAEFH